MVKILRSSKIGNEIEKRLDSRKYACMDTDEVEINWWDYAGTDYEYRYSDDCLIEAVRRANGRDLVFVGCLNPQTLHLPILLIELKKRIT